MQEKWIPSSFQSPHLHLVKSWQLLREIQSPRSPPPAQTGAAPASHPWLCLKVISRRSLGKADVLSCYYTLCPTCSSSQHPLPTGSTGLGAVSSCSCNTDHRHHPSLCLHKAQQQQKTFWEQIPFKINKSNSSEVWDPPPGSGERIQNKAQVCRLPMLLILSNVKQFQRVSKQH